MSRPALSAESRALEALQKQRQHWVELGPGVKVRFRRPLETEMHRFANGVSAQHVCEYVDGWQGVTEATLLGAAVGSDQELEFDPALWAAYVRDHSDLVQAVAKTMAEVMEAHIQARKAAAKN